MQHLGLCRGLCQAGIAGRPVGRVGDFVHRAIWHQRQRKRVQVMHLAQRPIHGFFNRGGMQDAV